jgi:hypothetical protein
MSQKITNKVLANAAIVYIMHKEMAARLRRERAALLSGSPCETPFTLATVTLDCYKSFYGLLQGKYCPRCQRSQSKHIEYRNAARATAVALKRLQRLVKEKLNA